MKKFTQLNEAENAKKIIMREDDLKFIDAEQIDAYVKKTAKSLSPEAKDVCQWLIDNNANYMKKLGKDGLAGFYNKGVPSDPELKTLYTNIGKLKQSGKLLQVPVFQTEGEFNGILNGEVHCDEVFLDFESEKGKNEIAKKFDPLCHKIARNYINKSSLDEDELYARALEGLAFAIHSYGKPTKTQIEQAERDGVEIDLSNRKKLTFFTYAGSVINNFIRGAITHDSHLVRIPPSRQQKIKAQQGFIPKHFTVSGDKKVGGGEDGEGRVLWDIVGGEENPYHNIDHQDVAKLRDEILKAIEDKFGKDDAKLYKMRYGLDGEEKIPVQDLAKKLGYKSSGTITAKMKNINTWITTDKKMRDLASTFYTLLREVRADDEHYENDRTNVVYVSESMTRNTNTTND